MIRFILSFFGIALFLTVSLAQGQGEIDSLVGQLKYEKRDTNLLKLLITISNKYYNNADYVNAFPFCEQALELAHEINDISNIAIVSAKIALFHEYFGDYNNALKNYLTAIKILESTGENIRVAELYQRIASFHKDDDKKSLEYYNKAFIYYEKSGSRLELQYALWSMSGSYIRWCQKSLSNKDSISANNYYIESIDLIKRALNLSKQANDTNNIAHFLLCLGTIYDKGSICDKSKIAEQSNLIRYNYFEQSIKSYEESILLYKLINSEDGITSTRYRIGNYYLNQGIIHEQRSEHAKANDNYGEALDNYFQALEGIKRLGYEHGIANFSKAIGETYSRLNNFYQAENYLLKSVAIFKKRQYRIGVLECYNLLSDMYEKKGNNKLALKYYKQFSMLSDSMENEESLKDINLLISQFELNKKENEVTLLKKENEIKESNIAKQRFQLYAIAIGFLLVILSLTFLIILNRNKRKREVVELNQQLLKTKIEALNAQMSDHFISNTMNSINKFIENNNKDKASEYLLLYNRVIRQVLENSFHKFVPLEKDLEVLKGYFNLEKLRFLENSLILEIEIEDKVDPQNILIPPMIFQTVVENSIIHGFKKSLGGTIKVFIRENHNKLECVVEDNGGGRNAPLHTNSNVSHGIQSYGSGLAERLVTISGDSYQVTDLFDQDGKSLGTRTSFNLNIISP